jgi:hypothetical protein
MTGPLVSDQQIEPLLAEPKPAVEIARFQPSKRKRRHAQGSFELLGDHGSRFTVVTRRSTLDPNDFSIILGWTRPEVTGLFHLLRCNGNSHNHPNVLEGETIRGFHVHVATERYQELGGDPEGFARPAGYSDFSGAIETFIDITGIRPSPDAVAMPLPFAS